MELREINVEDVYPDEKNPRKDFGDIEALAESCMLNAVSPGEPVNPIVVVQDGGIYRIVDGERRYKAMKRNRLSRCHAVVCEDMDEANVMVAMVATDDKQQLSEVERSRGVQQMMLLGVDPESVEKAGRIPKGSFAKLRRARAAVDDAGDDMTLERMLAIAEFDAEGDDDAVGRLMDASEGEWQSLASAIRQERRDEAQWDEIKGALEQAGIPLVEETDDRHTIWAGRVDSAAALSDWLASHPLDQSQGGYQAEKSRWGIGTIIYGTRTADEKEGVDPEAEERRRKIEDMEAKLEHGDRRHAAWYASCLKPNQYNPLSRTRETTNVDDFLLKSFLGDDSYYGPAINVSSFCETASIDPDLLGWSPLGGTLAAFLYAKGASELGTVYASDLVDRKAPPSYAIARIKRHLDWIELCESDGYELDEAEEDVKATCAAIIEGADAEENEEEGE